MEKFWHFLGKEGGAGWLEHCEQASYLCQQHVCQQLKFIICFQFFFFFGVSLGFYKSKCLNITLMPLPSQSPPPSPRQNTVLSFFPHHIFNLEVQNFIDIMKSDIYTSLILFYSEVYFQIHLCCCICLQLILYITVSPFSY